MASVTFETRLGGSGITVSDDADPNTGLANGGHRLRFLPALQGVVDMAEYTYQYAAKIDQAASDADRAENARGYVEAVADQYQVNILEQFKQKCTLGLDFAQGIYFVDDGTERVETTDPESILTVDRNTTKREPSPRGVLNEAGVDTISRRWLDGIPLGLSQEGARTNLALQSEDFNTTWGGGTTWVDSGTQSPSLGINYQRYVVPSNGAVNGLGQDVGGGSGRITISQFVGNDTSVNNILFAITDLAGGDSSRASVSILDETITRDNGAGNPVVYVEPCVNGKRIGVTFDSYDVALQRVVFAYKNTPSSISFASDLVAGNVVDATGVQVEFGESFSSYIPTTTAPVSRSADSIECPINSVGRDEITLYVEFYRNYNTTYPFSQTVLEIASSTDILSVECSVLNSRIRSSISPYDTLNFTPVVHTDKINRVALSIKNGVSVLSVNGQSIQSSDDNSGLISVLSGTTALSPKRTFLIQGTDYRPRIYLTYKATTAAELDALTAGGQS